MFPQVQQWKVIKTLCETTHYGYKAFWKALWNLQSLFNKGIKMVVDQVANHVITCLQNNPRTASPLLH